MVFEPTNVVRALVKAGLTYQRTESAPNCHFYESCDFFAEWYYPADMINIEQVSGGGISDTAMLDKLGPILATLGLNTRGVI